MSSQIVLRKSPLFFLCIAVLGIALYVIYILRFNGLFGQDAYEYIKLVRGYDAYFFSDAPMPYSVFPGFYPLTGFILSKIIIYDSLALQLISLLSLVVSCIYLKKILEHFHPKADSIYTYIFVLFALSPYVLRFALLCMSDMMNIALCIVFFYYLFIFISTHKLKHIVIISIVGTAAIYTRYASVIFLLPAALYLIVLILQSKKWIRLAIPFIIFLAGSIPEYIFRERFIFWDLHQGHISFSYFYVPQQWSVVNFFKKDFYNIDGWQHYSYANIFFVFQNFVHPAFIFLGICILPFVRKVDIAKKEIVLLLITICFYALFSAGYPYQSNRYLLLTYPLILIVYYPACMRLISTLHEKLHIKNIVVLGICIMQIGLFIYSSKVIYSMNKTEKNIADALKKYPNRTIYTCTIEGALATYNVNNPVVEIYSEKIDSVKKNSLLLFNYATFSKQFTHLNPMANWDFIQKNYTVSEIETYAEGWVLYSVN